jgi:hypothetical protein
MNFYFLLFSLYNCLFVSLNNIFVEAKEREIDMNINVIAKKKENNVNNICIHLGAEINYSIFLMHK